jgi:alpha-mannosidase
VKDERERILARAAHLLARYVEPARYGPPVVADITARHLHGEPVGYDDALRGRWDPFAVGDRWGGNWDTTWFRLRASVPAGWRGSEVDLCVDLGHDGTPGFGAEGQVWRNGAPLAGVNSRHRQVCLAAPARGGEQVDVYIEAAANPQGGGPTLLAPEYAGPPRLTLRQAEIAPRCIEVDELAVDLQVLIELGAALAADGRRTGEILATIRRACAVLDPRAVGETAAEVRKVLAGALDRPAAPGAHTVSAVGHAHIDTAWLWPLRETVRKCARTFSTALDLMDRHPSYRFACSQAQQHAWMRDRYPTVFAGMKARAADGRFEPVGSMWVEPDCNVPSGESLVRQLLYGKGWFLDAYGIETRDCWLPDAFGYPASLPQILAQAGVDTFISQKLSWNEVDRFPHHTFAWEGIDGSAVLAHFPPSDTYNGDFTVAQLRHGADNFRDHQVSGTSLYPFGYGDGGGGPTREMLQRAERVADLDGVPRVVLEGVGDFVRRVRSESPALPRWVGELYLEFHRGTYTTHGDVKAGNRRGELGLRDAELWHAGLPELRAAYPAAELGEAWRTLLLHQFHDILPGSGIHWVYEDTARDHAAVAATADRLSAAADAVLAATVATGDAVDPVVVVNAASHARDEVVAVGTPGGARFVRVTVPACGWSVVDLARTDPGDHGPTARDTGAAIGQAGPATGEAGPDRVEVSRRHLDNGRLRVELDDDGHLRRVYDHLAGREVLAAGGRGNLLQLQDDDPVDYDAWDIDEFSGDRVEEVRSLEDVEVVESGPLRGGIRLRRRWGRSSLVQTIRLRAGSNRIDFETEVDWRERHRLLKVAFPVAVRSMEATYEIQFGHVRRPTHTNTTWDAARFEVCGHRWADLSEAGYGVALLNDAKYGYDVRGHTLRLSLLRAPTAPDPEADQGRHRFVYSLFPHRGDHVAGRVVEEGLSLNLPLRVVPARPSTETRPATGSLVAFDRPGVVLEALKRAENDGDLVLRCYEADGGRGPVRVDLGLDVVSAWRCDLLERPGAEVAVARSGGTASLELDLRPFEIVTLRLHPADI